MFSNASTFSRPIGTWDVSPVENIECMSFPVCSSNQPFGNLNVGNVNNMERHISNLTSNPVDKRLVGRVRTDHTLHILNQTNIPGTNGMVKGREVFKNNPCFLYLSY